METEASLTQTVKLPFNNIKRDDCSEICCCQVSKMESSFTRCTETGMFRQMYVSGISQTDIDNNAPLSLYSEAQDNAASMVSLFVSAESILFMFKSSSAFADELHKVFHQVIGSSGTANLPRILRDLADELEVVSSREAVQ